MAGVEGACVDIHLDEADVGIVEVRTCPVDIDERVLATS